MVARDNVRPQSHIKSKARGVEVEVVGEFEVEGKGGKVEVEKEIAF